MSRAARITVVSLNSGTELQLLGPNAKRRALHFTFDNTNAVFFRTDSLGNVNGGLSITRLSSPLELTYEEYGDIVTRPWLTILAAGSGNIGIVEVEDGPS